MKMMDGKPGMVKGKMNQAKLPSSMGSNSDGMNGGEAMNGMGGMKKTGVAGGDPTLPEASMGMMTVTSTGGIMDFNPGKKAKFPVQGAKTSLCPMQQQELDSGFGRSGT